jgi:hypothetical protein
MKLASQIFHYSIPLLFFWLDIWCIGLMPDYPCSLTLCWYLVTLEDTMPWYYRLYVCLLLACSDTLVYNRCAISLIYIIPLSFVYVTLRYYTTIRFLLWVALVIALAGLQVTLIDGLVLGLSRSYLYTVQKIIANIGIISILSLKQWE